MKSRTRKNKNCYFYDGNLKIGVRVILRNIFILVMASTLVSCASMQLKPFKDTKATFIEETDRSKSDAFERTAVWLAKNLGDSNSAIKINDTSSGRLVAKITFPCKGLKRPDVIPNIASTDVQFNVDVAFKDKKVKYELEMLGFTRNLGAYGGNQHYFIAEATGQDVAVKNCFDDLKKSLKEAIEKKADEKAW